MGGCTGCVDSGGMGREGGEGGCVLASSTEALSLFLPPSPSCGFMAYLPVADFHVAMRDLLQRFLTESPGGEGSPAGLLCWTG